MAHMDPPSLPSPSCSPSGNSFHFPCVHANQASSDTNQSSFLLKTPINHRFYFLRTTIIYWYTSIYVVACFLRISIMYIAAIWEIMTTSNHLVSPFFSTVAPTAATILILSICFIYISIMVHIPFTMVHFPLPIINHNCQSATCLDYFPYFIDVCHMHQGFPKSWYILICAIKDWYLHRLLPSFYRCMPYASKASKSSGLKSRIELVIYTIKDWYKFGLLSFYN